jgi:signal transduction histidine kinase/CheY-like chemotaxis protein
MLIMLERFNAQLFLISGVIFVLLIVLYLYVRDYRILKVDISRVNMGMRILTRSGRAPQRMRLRTALVEQLWRKILSFYAGTLRTSRARTDYMTVLGSGVGLAEAGESEEEILQVLSEIVRRSAFPEVRFTGVLIKGSNGSWKLLASSGISRERLEEPLLLSIENLSLEGVAMQYTQPRDGIQFDYRGLGVGNSLFVPMVVNEEVFGIVWLGFGEGNGVLSENRKNTIEMIVKHAVSSFQSARRSKAKEVTGLEQKEKMLSLSHDMKAPSMRALYALKEVQQSSVNLGEDNTQLLSEIEYALEEQLGLIQSLFSVDLKEDISPRQSPEIEVSSLVKNRVESFKVIARAASIELSVTILERAKVSIPREVFHRILDNLITNAIKYTPEGSIEVSVTHGRNSVKQEIVVSVRDSGKGVPERLRESLFTSDIRKFEREVNSGHGYGLTVVKRLVEEHGGSVSYSPNPEGGSLFSFTIPATSILEGGYRLGESRKGILVIDDDSVIRSTYERWMKDTTDRVLSCGSFSEARVIMEFEKPSMIIMDVTIPGEDAGTFLQMIPRNIPVIVVSGMPQSVLEKEYGICDHVVAVMEKPFTRVQLREVIRKVIVLDPSSQFERAA